MRRALTAIQVLILILLPTLIWAWPGKVISIQDGDTITVLTEDKRQVRIRLYGIDAPEGGQAFGNRATQFVNELLRSRPMVNVDTKDTDRYGRAVAVIILPDGRLLNEEIVREGYAWVYGQYCKAAICQSWLILEKEARENRIGLWSHPDPIPHGITGGAGERLRTPKIRCIMGILDPRCSINRRVSTITVKIAPPDSPLGKTQ